MNKTIMFLGMLAVGFANAQQTNNYDGKVGINTEEPKATLDIVANKTDGSQKEGLLIPRLGKTAISKIAQPEISTLVYVNDIAYTTGEVASDKRVELVNTVGFYHYNGTQWVKHLDTDTNSELWSQKLNGAITETYLKPASESGDEYMYSPKKSYINLGNVPMNIERPWTPNPATLSQYSIKDRTPQLTMIDDTAFKADDNSNDRVFSTDVYNLKTSKGKQNIIGKMFLSSAKDITSDIDAILGVRGNAEFMSSRKVDNYIAGGLFSSIVGSDRGHTPTVGRNIGLRSIVSQYSGTTNTMMGLLNETYVYGGNVSNIYGLQTSVYSTNPTNSTYPVLNLNYMIGNRVTMATTPNTTVNCHYGGIYYSYFKNNSVISTEASGIVTSGYFEDGSNVKDYTGNYVYLNGAANATVEKLYGFRVEGYDLSDGISLKEMYGLYLGNINKGTEKSYAIYTNAGKVHLGDKVEVKSSIKIASPKTEEKCTSANAGTMSYKEINGSGVFGFCTKKASGEYVWAYLKGAHLFGESTNGGAFGNGLN